ncbi:MAG TPA: hypothetical protein VM733_04015, partial [Thermoanaerobaculia bacterium]|nr:hypothetical protein [Thermoanaerobaculia bacterium]
AGDRVEDVRWLLGNPKADAMNVENGTPTSLLLYVKSNGERWVVRVRNRQVIGVQPMESRR